VRFQEIAVENTKGRFWRIRVFSSRGFSKGGNERGEKIS